MYQYDRPSYTHLVYPTECYFPTWLIEEEHPVCHAVVDAFKGLFREDPKVDKWTFSTKWRIHYGALWDSLHRVRTRS